MKTKCLAVGIILLFVGIVYAPAIAQNTEKSQTSRGNWLYVGGSGPGNYTRIQDAIDNVSDGDTVYVYDDSSPYYENVNINKSIQLVGENQQTTVIDHAQLPNKAVSLTADEITFTGFTVRYKPSNPILSEVLYIHSNRSTIIGNTIIGLGFSHLISIIMLSASNNNTIKENTVSNGLFGIYLDASDDTTITGNNITKNLGYGITLANSRRNSISMNNIMKNGRGDAIFTRDIGIFPLSNHWDANYWGRPFFLPKRIPGKLILLDNANFILTLPLVNFDWHPAQEPYDIPRMN